MRRWLWLAFPVAVMVVVMVGWGLLIHWQHDRCADAGGRPVGSPSSRTGFVCVRPDGAVIEP